MIKNEAEVHVGGHGLQQVKGEPRVARLVVDIRIHKHEGWRVPGHDMNGFWPTGEGAAGVVLRRHLPK